jgi:hypothetical protein
MEFLSRCGIGLAKVTRVNQAPLKAAMQSMTAIPVGFVKGDNPVTLLLGIRHDYASSCFDQRNRFPGLNARTDHCARRDDRRSANPRPAVNRDRTAAGNTVSYRTGHLQRWLGFRNATIRNRKRDELDSARPAKLGFPLQSKFRDLLPFEKTYDEVDARSLPSSDVQLQPIIRTRTGHDGKPTRHLYPVQSGHSTSTYPARSLSAVIHDDSWRK